MAPDGDSAPAEAGGPSRASPSLLFRDIAVAWWPLALSWLMMGIEQPAIGAVIARLADPKIQLAAYGGVVFPLALVIEAPVIMLLAASTELSRDLASYNSLRRFTHRIGALLTVLHLVIAFTPVYDLIVGGILGVPVAVREPARLGLMILTPWTWAIAWRRFNQGVLIRFGRSRSVGWGSAVRLVCSAVVLGYALWDGRIPGIVAGSAALTIGVLAEGTFAALAVRSVVSGPLQTEVASAPPLAGRSFAAFYGPLALTPLIVLVIQPIGSAAISRMPDALSSLAVWPMVTSVSFVLQALGLAFNEVVVALAGRPGARPHLRRFAVILVVGTTSAITLLAVTPLADLWMGTVAGLPAPLAAIAAGYLWMIIPVPGCRALQSWHQGLLVVARKTQAVTESVIVFFVSCAAVLLVGVYTQRWPGLPVALIGFSVGRLTQTAWLAFRARHA